MVGIKKDEVKRSIRKAEMKSLIREPNVAVREGINDEVEPVENSSGEKVKEISVIGERNSGTTWIWNELTTCFNNTVKVKRRLTRYKHWFQYEDGKKHPATLVLAIFRDPYYWIAAMRKKPHHAPMHLHLDWKTFVTKQWTMPRVGKDLEMVNQTGRICQQEFYFHEVVSCNDRPYPDGHFKDKKPGYSGHQPFYEMKNDGSGKPYDNILDLRRDKIINFLEVANWTWVEKFWILRYEDLLKTGTANLIKQIENLTGVKARCVPSSPQNRTQRSLQSDFLSYLNEHVDWNTEHLIGYKKWESNILDA